MVQKGLLYEECEQSKLPQLKINKIWKDEDLG